MNIIKSYNLLRAYRSDPLGFMTKMHKEQGHRIVLNFFGKKIYVLSDPQDVLQVLKNNSQSYSKGRTTKLMGKFLGNGLVTNEGDSWKKQHKLIRPMMNIKSVFELAPRMLETTKNFLSEFDSAHEIDAFHNMNRLTWRIVLKTLFTLDTSAEMDKWLDDVLDMMDFITTKTRSSLPLPFWIPTKSHLHMKSISKKFDDHVYKLVKERRSGEKKSDLLQLLIDAEMSALEIRDEVMTFMLAGHETITNTMTWTLIELARNPQHKARLLSESDKFFASKNFEELHSAEWISAVIDESMRLWPAIWAFMRESIVPDTIGEYKIQPGTNVVLCPYVSHRSPELWETPEVFNPNRFLPDGRKKILPGAYIPFGFGPRSCIGSNFALVEAKIILATLIHHFDWEIKNIEQQKAYAGISLRPLNNVKMVFRRRV